MIGTTRAVFPGSFDPMTMGHLDLVERALKVFDEIVVAVLHNAEKRTLFSAEERVSIIQESCAAFGNRVRAESFSGLLVDFARRANASVMIRGLRAISDYDYEVQMALMNRSLNDQIETLFLPTRERYSYVSSTVVKQVAALGGDVSRLVPAAAERMLKQRFSVAKP